MSSYQGLLWPIRPKPLVGEVLSSWVSRTGAVADVSLQEFLRQRLPKKAGYRFDLDKIEQPDFYEALAAGAGVTVEEARATSYLRDEGLVYARRTFNNLEWIAPLSVAGRRGRHNSIPFCPSCLAEDSEPFIGSAGVTPSRPYAPSMACSPTNALIARGVRGRRYDLTGATTCRPKWSLAHWPVSGCNLAQTCRSVFDGLKRQLSHPANANYRPSAGLRRLADPTATL